MESTSLAKTLKACALIGLHLMAEEHASVSCGSLSPDWYSDVRSWTESEGTSSFEQHEHNIESLALNSTGRKLVRQLARVAP